MTKVAEQNIPSEYRQYWNRIFNPTMEPTTGFNYIIDGYEYCSLLGVRMSKANNNKQGKEYPKISESQAVVRCRLSKASGWANMQVESGGVLYPETGPRDKSWWYDNIPIGGCYWNDYCIYEAQPHLDYNRIPPWALSPTIWICAQMNYRLEKWDGRTMKYLSSTTGGSGTGEQFGSIIRSCVDETKIYVCDYQNHKIHVLYKDTLQYIEFHSETKGGVHEFYQPFDIAVDDENLYILEWQASVWYVVRKNDFELIDIRDLSSPNDFTGPEPRGISIDYNFIHIADWGNAVVKVYSRKNYSLIKELTNPGYQEAPNLAANDVVSDGQNIYAIDGSHFLNIAINIASGKVLYKNEYADACEGGIGISGDLVFVMGQLSSTLFKLVRPALPEIDKLYNPGTNPGQFNLNMGVCGQPGFSWDHC